MTFIEYINLLGRRGIGGITCATTVENNARSIAQMQLQACQYPNANSFQPMNSCLNKNALFVIKSQYEQDYEDALKELDEHFPGLEVHHEPL